jgi:hypothetical protein
MSKPSYTGIVLNAASRAALLAAVPPPEGFEKIAHHMTINLGEAAKGPAAHLLGREVKLTLIAVGRSEKVVAARVETTVPSINEIKHVTVGVNRAAGGKPFDSNKITDWHPLHPDDRIELTGTVTEVGH